MVRRIIGKVILHVVHSDLLSVCGTMQMCAGQPAGSEAAVHAMKLIFDDKDAEAVLFAHAKMHLIV